MPRPLPCLFLVALSLTGVSTASAQTLKASFPAKTFEVALRAPLFRSARDTTKGAELFMPVGSSLPVVGIWNPRWAVVSYSGYLYMTPVSRLRGLNINDLPASIPDEPLAPVMPIDPATKLITYEAVVEIPGATKDQLYDRALEWMAKTYQSANDVVQIKDKEQGKLLAKGGIPYVYHNILSGYVVHTQTIYVKDGRYKYVMTGFKHQYVYTGTPLPRDGSMGALEQTTPPSGFRKKAWYDMLQGTNDKVKAMIADLEQAMQAKGKDPSKF